MKWLSVNRRTCFKAAASLFFATWLALPAVGGGWDRDDDRWVGTWTASPQHAEPPFVLPTPAQFDNQTIRQVVHSSIAGDPFDHDTRDCLGVSVPQWLAALVVRAQAPHQALHRGSPNWNLG